MQASIVRAQTGDAAAIRALLEAQQLPVDGFSDHLQTMLVAKLEWNGRGKRGARAVHRRGAASLGGGHAGAPGSRLGRELTTAAIELARTRARRPSTC